MVRASKGYKRGTRRKMKRGVRHKFNVEERIKEFKPGDKVIIRISPSSRSFPPPRYLGLTGVVRSERGEAYIISVRSGKKKKSLLVKPENIRLAGGQHGN